VSGEPLIRDLEPPYAPLLGESPEEFLNSLKGPSWFVVKGSGSGRPRAIMTLLHGNEPSGFRALRRWLASDPTPPVDIHICVASVEAASTPPLFTWRERRDGRDLNRAFRAPYEDYEGSLAKEILDRLLKLNPEALVDLHNTSGSGPSFGLAAVVDERHKRLSSFFSERMVRLGSSLGTLMEATVDVFPALIVECGGVPDSESDAVALQGIKAFTESESLWGGPETDTVEFYEKPTRIKLKKGLRLVYADSRSDEADLTLRDDIDRLNHGVTASGELLGWLHGQGLDALLPEGPAGGPALETMLRERDGRLETACEMKILLATTRSDIGVSDCLFYIIPSS